MKEPDLFRQPDNAGAVGEPAARLSHFLPTLLLEQLQEDGGASSTRELAGAALFVDISGFSDLSEQFSERGVEGAELLTRLLNSYFARLIDRIHRCGGDVLDFSGDAILAFWPAGEHSLQGAALAATACACLLRDEADNYEMEEYDGRIRMKIGMGVGLGYTLIMGERGRVRKFALVGKPCEEVGVTIEHAKPGDIVLTENLRSVLGAAALCEPLRDDVVRLLTLNRGANYPARRAIRTTTYTEQALRDFVVPAVLQPFDAGQEKWIAEFRGVSVLFVNIVNLSCADESGRTLLRSVFEHVLDIAAPLEGVVLQTLQDDKGAVLEVVFGLPPISHEDDALRAVIASQRMQKALLGLNVQFGIGLTTGSVFCGTYGSRERRHYAAVGNIVNLAARLMQKADQQVLCDHTTFLRASGARHRHGRPVGFAAQQPLRLKGHSQAVEVYIPFELDRDEALIDVSSSEQRGFVGRVDELARLDALLDMVNAGRSAAVVIRGEAGIGKSMLVAETVWRASGEGIRHFVAAADAVEHATPYYALRGVFQQLLGLDPAASQQQMASHIQAVLGASAELAPLLNAVVPAGLEETHTTQQMTGEVRADATRDLLLSLIYRSATEQPLLLVVEDLHWLDSVSWEFAKSLTNMRAPVGVLITTRPMADESPTGFDAFVGAHDVQVMDLANLPAEQISQLAANALGIKSVSDAVQELVFSRSEGHPLFARELVFALQEAGLLQARSGQADFRVGAMEQGPPFPDTLKGIITSRLDRLAPSRNVTLKVGSVIGRTFAVPVLNGVRLLRASEEALINQLDAMASDKLLTCESSEPESRFSFAHVLIREVAYHQLPFAQRREYHARTASYIEQQYGGTDRHQFAQLAHHWQMAGDVEKSLGYLDLSSKHALIDGAHKECITFAQRALALAENAQASALRRATWEQRIGEAYYCDGNIELSDEHIRRSLALLGEEIPSGNADWRRRALRELVSQARHLVRRSSANASADDKERLGIAALAYGVLGEQGYFHSDATMWFAMSLAAINCAEAADQRVNAGRSYGGMGYAMGAARMRPLAKRFFSEANSHQNARSWGISYCGEGNWHVAFGRWQRAFDVMEDGIRRSKNASDHFTLGFARAILGQAYDFSGHLDKAAAVFQQQREDAYKNGNRLYLAWALCDLAANRLATGQLAEARALLREAEPVVDDIDSYSQMRRFGVDALVCWMLDDHDAAHASAVAALDLARVTPLFQSSFFWMAYGTAHTLVELYGAAQTKGHTDREMLLGQAREACQRFGSLARVFPIMKSRHLQTLALLRAFEGKPRRAGHLARKAIRRAKRFDMPLDAGLAHLLRARLGRMRRGSQTARGRRHEALAESFLSSVGAKWHLEHYAQREE